MALYDRIGRIRKCGLVGVGVASIVGGVSPRVSLEVSTQGLAEAKLVL